MVKGKEKSKRRKERDLDESYDSFAANSNKGESSPKKQRMDKISSVLKGLDPPNHPENDFSEGELHESSPERNLPATGTIYREGTTTGPTGASLLPVTLSRPPISGDAVSGKPPTGDTGDTGSTSEPPARVKAVDGDHNKLLGRKKSSRKPPSATISRPPTQDLDDFFRDSIFPKENPTNKVSTSGKPPSGEGTLTGKQDAGIELHPEPCDTIEDFSEEETNDLPFSDKQITLLKMVISDSIDKKLKNFQQPDLNETLDDVTRALHSQDRPSRSKHRSSVTDHRVSRRPSPSHSSSLRSIVQDKEDPPSDQDSQEDIDPESLNLPLSTQFSSLSKIFPEEIKPTNQTSSSIRRPDMRSKEPSISQLPLHSSIKHKIDNAHHLLSSNQSKIMSREETSLPTGKFPEATSFRKSRYAPSDFADFSGGYKIDSKVDSLTPSSSSNISRNWCVDMLLSSKVANENKRALCHDSFATWFADASYESIRKTYEGIKEKSLSKEEVLANLQEAMNFICTSMNSTHFSADHSLRSLIFNTLAQRDTIIHKFDKDLPASSRFTLRAAPFNTSTLFAGETDKAFEDLQKIKQTKDRNINISFRPQDFKTSDSKSRGNQQRVLKPWERKPASTPSFPKTTDR